MQWEKLTKKEAEIKTKEWQNLPAEDFNILVSSWPSSIERYLNTKRNDYLILRKKVYEVYNNAKSEVAANSNLGTKKGYLTDLRFAIYFYVILKALGFNARLASDDQVWMYLCVNVFPDIVHERYPGSKIKTKDGIKNLNINEDRFWRSKRRIYLKVLWWYIYLSLQFDRNGKEDFNLTYRILVNNTTDEVVQLVERAGSGGYRVDVYRALMEYYHQNRNKYDTKIFRKVMVLNTARAQVVEPLLVRGGVKTYVKELFEYFDEN